MRTAPLACLLLLGGLEWITGCHHRNEREQEKMALHIPKESPRRPQGSAALTVRKGEAEPFTKADVADYFKTHRLPMATATGDPILVDSLEFLTNAEVTHRLNGASPGLAETDKVGFATLRGVFIFTGPPPGKPVRFSRAYAAFDAVTGNLLMIGTLEQGERPR